MKKNKKIQLNLGNPTNGWIPVEFISSDYELKFIASNIPENPIDKLCQFLILALNGIETEMCWNLEPECNFFELRPCGNKINLIISKSGGITQKRNLIYEMDADLETVLLPLYRSVKKFSTLEFDKADWNKIDSTKLNKLTNLINERKNYWQHRI